MYLGIDIGTSSVKVVVVDGEQAILATATAPLSVSRPHELWSEQDPQDWWAAVEQAVAELRHKAGPAWHEIKAIGLSGQMHGAVLLDEAGLPIRPAILHNDGRSHAEAQELNKRLPEIGTIAGVPAMPGFAAPKLLWMARHEPDMLARARHLLLPKDYVRFRMTGGCWMGQRAHGRPRLPRQLAFRCRSCPRRSRAPPFQGCCRARWPRPGASPPAPSLPPVRAMRRRALLLRER